MSYANLVCSSCYVVATTFLFGCTDWENCTPMNDYRDRHKDAWTQIHPQQKVGSVTIPMRIQHYPPRDWTEQAYTCAGKLKWREKTQ